MSEWTVACDFLFQNGGAEKVVSSLIHDVLRDKSKLVYLAGDGDVVTDVAGCVPQTRVLPTGMAGEKSYRHLSPLYPTFLQRRSAIEGNVIASSYAFAHHLRATGSKVVYCHSPLRQVWSGAEDYLESASACQRVALNAVRNRLRLRDRAAARTADAYIATSSVVKDRIHDYYGRANVEVIPPPIDVDRFATSHWVAPGCRGDSYLFVGRLVEPYKRVSLAIEAFRRLPHLRLVIAGDGRDRQRLENSASPNVEFVGWKRGEELVGLYQQARGLIFPSTDDFGIVPVEAAAAATPTICHRSGGALDTVVHGQTGIFFDTLDPRALADAVRVADANAWRREDLQRHAHRFSAPVFVDSMRSYLSQFS
jgi:glycosyltransferase involved in cell wall biosynthesis